MRTHKFASGLLIIICLILTSEVAAKPNFGGKWKLDPSQTPGMPPTMDWTMFVKHKGDTLSVVNIIKMADMKRTQSWRYITDGSLNVNTEGIKPEALTKSRCKWEGDELVINSGDETISMKDTWSLSEDGKTLTITKIVGSAEEKQTMKSVYTKM